MLQNALYLPLQGWRQCSKINGPRKTKAMMGMERKENSSVTRWWWHRPAIKFGVKTQVVYKSASKARRQRDF
jgi:hypothetical protein